MTRTLLTMFLFGFAAVSAPAIDAVVPQSKVEVKIKNADRVYRPSTLNTGQTVERTKPAVLNSRQIFAATPEYKQIKKGNLDPSSAEAMLLKKRASDRFKAAMRVAASSGGYDLIAERGAIEVKSGSPTDITQEVIGFLQ